MTIGKITFTHERDDGTVAEYELVDAVINITPEYFEDHDIGMTGEVCIRPTSRVESFKLNGRCRTINVTNLTADEAVEKAESQAREVEQSYNDGYVAGAAAAWEEIEAEEQAKTEIAEAEAAYARDAERLYREGWTISDDGTATMAMPGSGTFVIPAAVASKIVADYAKMDSELTGELYDGTSGRAAAAPIYELPTSVGKSSICPGCGHHKKHCASFGLCLRSLPYVEALAVDEQVAAVLAVAAEGDRHGRLVQDHRARIQAQVVGDATTTAPTLVRRRRPVA